MSEIKSEGRYTVTLSDCHWVSINDGMQAVLTGTTGSGDTAIAYLSATKTIIQSGKNQGKELRQATLENLVELGMPNDPAKIHELDNKRAIFVMETDTYNGDKRLKVSYVNAERKPPADNDKVVDFFSDMPGAPAPSYSSHADNAALFGDDDIGF